MPSKVYIIDPMGSVVILEPAKGKVSVPLDEESSLYGSAIAAQLLKMANEHGFLPFVKTDGHRVYYVGKLVLIAELSENENYEKAVEFLAEIEEAIISKKAEILDDIVDAMVEFLKTKAPKKRDY